MRINVVGHDFFLTNGEHNALIRISQKTEQKKT